MAYLILFNSDDGLPDTYMTVDIAPDDQVQSAPQGIGYWQVSRRVSESVEIMARLACTHTGISGLAGLEAMSSPEAFSTSAVWYRLPREYYPTVLDLLGQNAVVFTQHRPD